MEIYREKIKKSKYNTAVTAKSRNAYTPEEIIEFFKKEKINGKLDAKVDEYVQKNARLNASKQIK